MAQWAEVGFGGKPTNWLEKATTAVTGDNNPTLKLFLFERFLESLALIQVVSYLDLI